MSEINCPRCTESIQVEDCESETLHKALSNAERALAFYANQDNYSPNPLGKYRDWTGHNTAIRDDDGATARLTLAEIRRVLTQKSEER